MNTKKRYLLFDDMELYQKVLCDLAKQGLVFTIGKTGCHVTREQSETERREERKNRRDIP